MVTTPNFPPPPDPLKTAEAQGQLNQNTATTQQLLNMTDQDTPEGSLAYNQTGTNSFVGADGKTYTVPKFKATTTLSDANKGIFDIGKQTETNLATIGRDQSAKIGGILGTNVNLNNDAVEGRLMELATKRLDPRFARDEESLRTRLSNSGIQAGSAAWGAEMGRLGETKNDAVNELLLKGRGQSIQEILTERNQPLNEISALMSGSQVGQPNFTNTPSAQVGGVDYTGLVNNNYNAQIAQANMKAQQQNAMMGGLFGMLGSGAKAAAMWSDRRLKRDIERIGTAHNGLPLYFFRYLWSDVPQVGLMADDVLKIHPEAVLNIGGFLAVDYEKALA